MNSSLASSQQPERDRVTRGTRTLWAQATGIFFTAGTTLLGFIAMPWLIRWLGNERLGAYRAAADWFGHLGLLDLGLGGAILPLLAEALARQDRLRLQALLQSARAELARVVLLVLAIGTPLAFAMPYLVPVPDRLHMDLTAGCLLGLLASLFLPLTPYRILLEAGQRSYWINVLLLGQSIFTTLAALYFAWLGWGIRGQFLATTAGIGLGMAALWLRGRRLAPAIGWRHLWQRREVAILRRIRHLQGAAWTINLAGRLQLYSDNIIVAAALGPALVVPFWVTQKLTGLGQREAQRVSASSWAALAEMYHHGEYELYRRRFLDLTRTVSVLGCVLMTPIVVYNRFFIAAWLGAGFYAGNSLTLLASFNAILLAIFTVWGYCLEGAGLARCLVWPTLIQSGLNLGLSILLAFSIGWVGPVLATTISFLGISSWWLPRLIRRNFGLSLRKVWMAAWLPLPITMASSGAFWEVASRWPPQGLANVVLQMLGATLGGGLLCWWLAFTSRQRREHVQRLRLALRWPGVRAI